MSPIRVSGKGTRLCEFSRATCVRAGCVTPCCVHMGVMWCVATVEHEDSRLPE